MLTVLEVRVPRLTPEREQARRTRILTAARNAFVEHGLHRTTTHDVARAAGVPVGSIYTYFTSKDELIHASILAANKAETEAILADVRSGGTTRERLLRAIAGWYAYTIEAPGVATFLADAWAETPQRPLIRDIIARRRERSVTLAALLLAEGVTAGDLPPDLDVVTTSRAVANLLDGLVIERLEGAGDLDLASVQRRVLLLLPFRG